MTVDMNDVRIVKASDDVNDGVTFPYIGEEFIAETFAFGSTGDKTLSGTETTPTFGWMVQNG